MMSQPVDVLCTADEFKALRCAYTGEPYDVYMLVVPGQPPKFHAPNAYSPSQPFETAEKAYRMWNRVDGVEGLKSGRPITCAYTGEMLAAASDRDGHWLTGGFDPRMFHSRADFLRYATMRDGKPVRDSGDSRIEVAPVDWTPVKKREIDTEPTDEAVKIAAGVLQKHKAELPSQAVTTVSMSVPSAKKGKKR